MNIYIGLGTQFLKAGSKSVLYLNCEIKMQSKDGRQKVWEFGGGQVIIKKSIWWSRGDSNFAKLLWLVRLALLQAPPGLLAPCSFLLLPFRGHRPLQAPPGSTDPYKFRRSYESIQSLVAFTTFLGSMLGGQKVTNCCWKKERKENCILCSSEQVLSKKIIGWKWWY